MVYEVKGAQQQSSQVVMTLPERCTNMIYKAKCLPTIDEKYIKPVLAWYAAKNPPVTVATDPVNIAWNILRQGGLLCSLLNQYRPNTINDCNEIDGGTVKSASIFSNSDAKENVKRFLKSCEEELYMQGGDLFAAKDLYTENTNILTKAIAFTDKFFDKIAKTHRIPFEKMIAKFKEADEAEAAAAASKESSGSRDSLERRLRVLEEFVSTENAYIADLDQLLEYREELVADKVINDDVLHKIFANLLDLTDFQHRYGILVGQVLNKQVLKDIQQSYDCHLGKKLFIDMESGFSVYNEYVANRATSREAIAQNIDKLMVKAKIMDPQGTLDAFLIKPIQRICKYPLLLREIIKNSDEDAKDIKELQEAYKVADHITTRINELMTMGENDIEAEKMKMLVTDWSIKGVKIDPDELGRLFRYEKVFQVGKEGTNAEVTAYLFESMLLTCRAGKASIVSSRPVLNLKSCFRLTSIQNTENISSAATKLYGIRFNASAGGDIVTSLAFKVKNAESIKLWLKACKSLGISEIEAKEMVVAVQENNKRASYVTKRREEVISTSEPLRGAIPVSTPAMAATRAQDKPTDYPPGTIQLKLVYNNECYMRLIPSLPTIEQIKKFAIKTISADFERFDLPFSITKENMCLKYMDDDKDLINIMDQNDLSIALMCNGHRLIIYVFDMRKIEKGTPVE